jgi:hypothetical protein
MKDSVEPFCTICLEPRTENDGWFLLTENRWTDRVKILGWSDALAAQPGVHAACGAEHVQQLVIHWMAMGTLDYPFARTHSEVKKSVRNPSLPPAVAPTEPDTRGMRVYGELAVHRESLERILSESPESLGSVLTALISALGHHGSPTKVENEEQEDELLYALT